MPSILDHLSSEDREKAIARGKKRLEKRDTGSVSPEMYLITEFGYYLGWEAILAVKRGYIESRDGHGKIVKEPFELDEMMALLEGLRKVWYSKQIEIARTNLVAVRSANHQSDPTGSFEKGMQPFKDRIK